MSYYKVCPHCGAHLDPGEQCDCLEIKGAAQGATNALDGKVEQCLTGTASASDDNTD